MRYLILLLVVLGNTIAASFPSGMLRFQRGFIEAVSNSHGYLYAAKIGAFRVYCRPAGVSIVTPSYRGDTLLMHRFDLDFPSSPRAIIPNRQRPEHYRFTDGSHTFTQRSFDELRYVDVAPGVDVVLDATGEQLKYDVIVHPGSSPERVRFHLRHGWIASQDNSGALVFTNGAEELLDQAPIAYQQCTNGTTRPVSVKFKVDNPYTFGYSVQGDYDASLPLIIDPAIVWSTYVGGSQEDAANDLTTDASGNIYVAGNSLSLDFPLRGTTANRGRQNIVVAKFSASGQHLWSTYFGGERDEVAKAIVCDGATVLVGGWSSSPSVILDQPFPNRSGGAFDAIVLAFTTDGAFVRGTFLGGSREELINALALRRDGTLIAVGRTNSNNFPIAQALQPTLAGENDVFITALALPTLSVVWSTYYGGSAFDEAYGVTVSPTGSVYVTGVTVSTDFPVANAFQPRPPGLDNAFVIAINSAGRRLWASYLGGNDYDLGNRISYWNGKLYIAGTTSSEDFPVIGDSVAQRTKSGYNDAFLICLSDIGEPIWSTFWGGRSAESGFSVNVLPDGRVILAGSTSSADFPRRRSILWSLRGGDDVFVALFRDGINLWSATFGGTGDDILYATALLPSGDIIGTGETRSPDFIPLVNPQYSPSSAPSNRSDCFLFRLCPFTPLVKSSSTSNVLCSGQTIELWASDSSDISSILWSTGSSAHRIVVSSPGSYWFTATTRSGCTAVSDTVQIRAAATQLVLLDTIAPRPTLRLCPGERVGFVMRGRYRSRMWYDGSGRFLSSADTLWITTAQTIRAIAEDTNGCIVESSLHVVTLQQRPSIEYRYLQPDRTWLRITADTLRACVGQTITVEIDRPPGALCQWSDGSSQCQRTISTNLLLTALVIDSIGCSWQLRPLAFEFVARTKPRISTRDTVCIGDTIVISASAGIAPIRWQFPPSLSLAQLTSDSTQWIATAFDSGTYRIRAWYNSPCTDTTEQEITVVAPPRIRISASRQALCPNQSAVLSVPSVFSSYLWNGRAGDSVLVVSDTGWYHFVGINRFGCTAIDSIFIAARKPLVATATTLDFGVVEVGESAQQRITLINRSDTLALAQQRPLRMPFTTLQPPQQEITIGANDTLTLVIEFTPAASGTFSDTLFVIQQQPCTDTLVIIVAGTGRKTYRPMQLHFTVGSITVSPLDQYVEIPLSVWGNDAEHVVDSLSLEIAFNPTMLLPDRVEPGRIVGISFRNDRAYLNAHVRIDSIPKEPQPFPFGRLYAAVLLGDREEDRIEIRSAATIPSALLTFTAEAGTMRYRDLCRAGGSRLIGQRWGAPLVVVPAPVEGEALIYATPMESGSTTLVLYALDGRRVWSMTLGGNAGTMHVIPFPPIVSGTYILRMVSSSAQIATQVVVLR
ncbi:MAG: SBBP repeat-containing protein [Bacteroidota bacterium]|nr:SBBP repeat-containing protein [Candidatus Kapabacteria bacterium]MCX7936617.1 SBBP repeat-containing protein [Chlorobiota bacterium]MDW8074810.1 SBBP repeat-containing protein [Bacteroidota bacterium]